MSCESHAGVSRDPEEAALSRVVWFVFFLVNVALTPWVAHCSYGCLGHPMRAVTVS